MAGGRRGVLTSTDRGEALRRIGQYRASPAGVQAGPGRGRADSPLFPNRAGR